ncbi:hypothetical protein GRX03_04390 [Halovenus sp. WSH3]|uniref:Uncharacterized protein n=1 Tax=Halovenus carboxidivorans TaxID=2692199 RepID=A0A6B0SZC4_9EURY|nr:hypothetical protein [Halovenus carboxidivorans]MXR50845.1 hypothetical protein [Halovenus carboxidivorans]
MSERVFVCLDCGTRVETFLEPCPDCDSEQFKSTTADSGDEREEPLTEELAKLTRPVNPIAPAAGD